MNPPSPNTQAILLLTAPLIQGREAVSTELLSPAEYQHLARQLRTLKRQPADLIDVDGIDLIHQCHEVIDEQRLTRLLNRGMLLSSIVDRWQERSIWVVSRADAEYPRCFKNRLREAAPPILYGCGDIGLANTGGLAVVGSRKATDELFEYARGVGKLAADAGRVVISGGAKGVDQAAMRSALDAGGRAIGVLSDGLERAVFMPEYRQAFIDGRLLLMSPNDPNCGYTVQHALSRNQLIYALSDVALVVNAVYQQGGTWAGAVKQLDRHRFVPLYIRVTDEESLATSALLDGGALPWPEPETADALNRLFEPECEPPNPEADPPSAAVVEVEPEEALFATVREVLRRLLATPMKEAEVAAAMRVSKVQARAWLNRLVEAGMVEKLKKPVRYKMREGC